MKGDLSTTKKAAGHLQLATSKPLAMYQQAATHRSPKIARLHR
jgi:hypothetical protein